MSERDAGSQVSQVKAREPEATAEQISVFYLELGGLLTRLEQAVTHYQTLSVERSAGHEEIQAAYRQAVALLFPPYKIGATVPAPMLQQMERAFIKLSQAFAVLATFDKRAAYDASALAAKTGALPSPPLPPPAHVPPPPPPASETISIKQQAAQREVHTESSKKEAGDNRRRCERFRMSIPARVTGHDRAGGKWQEMTETINVSRTGVRVRLRRNVRHGTLLHLILPLPMKLRAHAFTEASYSVYALVRRVDPPKDGLRTVGLEFLGEHPPQGYLEKPWAVFRTKQWGGSERRRRPREARSVMVWLEYFDDAMRPIAQDAGMTEDLSRSGARIRAKTIPPEFDTVRVTVSDRSFESLASVTNRFVGKDGIERLCVHFLEKEWPM